MKKPIKFINYFAFLLIFITSNSFAFDNSDLEAVYDTSKFSLYAEGGYRMDNLNYNIASDRAGTATPNIASELKWDKLQIYQYKVGVTIPVFTIQEKKTISYKPYYLDTAKLDKQNLYFNISAGTGQIFSGENQDSDYDGNDRTLEYSRSDNNGGKGTVRDYDASINYEVAIKFLAWKSSITPQIGYSQYEQHLRITDGMQTLSNTSTTTGNTPPDVGPIKGLNSTYDTRWRGPFAGISLSTIYDNKHSFALNWQYHIIKYYAQGNWNLSEDFNHPKSFSQDANGKGISVSFEYGYKIFENLTLSFNANYRKFKTDPGKIKFYNSNDTTVTQRLNAVNWDSVAGTIGLKFNF